MLFISNNSKNINVHEMTVHHAALATLKAHKAEDCEVSILLTNDTEVQALNHQYRDIDAPTDVLAFSMREGEDANLNPHLLGDLVISIQTAQRQASEHQHSVEAELALLTVHGILHLLGYDHQTPEETAVMFEKQEEILRLI